MASIFGKDPSKQPPQDGFARDRIEQEIAHLKKPKSTRSGPNERKTLGAFVTFVMVLVVVALFVMDPFFYSWHKGDAIKAYLYLHNYNSGGKVQALAASGILTETEIDVLNHRQGTFQDYYPSAEDAGNTADAIIHFMDDLRKVRHGPYEELDVLGKIRYNLFCRWGLMPPVDWAFLDPEIKDQ